METKERNVRSLEDEQLAQVAGGGFIMERLMRFGRERRRRYFLNEYNDGHELTPKSGTLYRLWTGRDV